jgi:hypothetical protein
VSTVECGHGRHRFSWTTVLEPSFETRCAVEWSAVSVSRRRGARGDRDETD